MVGGTPSHNMTPWATGKGGCGLGGGGFTGSTMTFGFRSGEKRSFKATSAKSITLTGATFSRGARPGTCVAGSELCSKARSRVCEPIHSRRNCQYSRTAITSSAKSSSRNFPVTSFSSSQFRQILPLRHQAACYQARDRQADRHGLLLGMRGSKTDFLGGDQLRLRAQGGQVIDQLFNAAIGGDRHTHLAISRAKGPGTAEFHLPHFERRHLLLRHPFDHLQQLRLRLFGCIAGDETFLASDQF